LTATFQNFKILDLAMVKKSQYQSYLISSSQLDISDLSPIKTSTFLFGPSSASWITQQ